MGFLIAFVLAAVGGFLGALAFPHWNLWLLLFPSLTLLLSGIRRAGTSRHPNLARFLIAMVWGLTFFAPQISWITTATNSLVSWIALTVLESFFIGGFGLFWGLGEDLLNRHPRILWPLYLVWAAVAWLVFEQLRSLFPFQGFPWAKLGFAMVDSPLSAWAPWGGTIAVGAAVIMISLGVMDFFSRNSGFFRRLVSAILVLAILVVPQFIPAVKPASTGNSLRIAVIQGNTPRQIPSSAGGIPSEVLNLHVEESLKLLESLSPDERVDLVLWAENAADIDPRINIYAQEQVNKVASAFNAPMIFGTLGFNNKDIKNTIVFWKNNRALETYSKQHLVPFGEYLPWRKLFEIIAPNLSDLIPADISPGKKTAQIKIDAGGHKAVVATPVCFEIADDLIMQKAAQGANFIVVPTSNASFGSSDEATQQLAIARFRAKEHGLDTVQVSTMSSTARIDAEGQILGKIIPSNKSGSFITAVPLRLGTTLATSYFHSLINTTLLIFGVMILTIFTVKVKESWNND